MSDQCVLAPPPDQSAIAVALKNYRSDDRKAVAALFPVVTRLSKVAAWSAGRKELADDLAQEFWLRADVVAETYDPTMGPAEPFILGFLRNIIKSLSRKNPVPLEDKYPEEDIYDSMAAIACADEKLDRKLAIAAIKRKVAQSMSSPQVSSLPFVSVGKPAPMVEPVPAPTKVEPAPRPKKPRCAPGPDHNRLREIRLALDMTQSDFAAALGLVTVTLVSYERGQTKKVPAVVMENAEELYRNEDAVLDWRAKFDNRSMTEILETWAADLQADPSDLTTMAALTGTVPSTILRWRNGECRPNLRELVAYEATVRLNARRLEKSGLLINTKIVREKVEGT